MAIDSSLFAVAVPAGAYAVGDVLELGSISGPANVRSGRGEAILKSILVGTSAQTAPFWRVHIQNSNWIDDIQSFAAGTIGTTTMFDEESGSYQRGHDSVLYPNSGWRIYAECVYAGTSTSANDIYCLIDIDYPQVSAVTDPAKAVGVPCSIAYDKSLSSVAYGGLESATWTVQNVDYLKAGYQYVLDSIEIIASSSIYGFMAFSNAAGMGGLTRIIPFSTSIAGIRYPVKYSSAMVKGPMDVKIIAVAASSSTVTINSVHDYVKRS